VENFPASPFVGRTDEAVRDFPLPIDCLLDHTHHRHIPRQSFLYDSKNLHGCLRHCPSALTAKVVVAYDIFGNVCINLDSFCQSFGAVGTNSILT